MDYSYSVDYPSNVDVGALKQIVELIAVYGSIITIISVVVSLLIIIEYWIIFDKCGKHGWAAIVPIYNLWTYLECAGIQGWLCLLPVANLIALLVATFKLPKQMGRSGALGLGILLFPPIFLGVLAFGNGGKTSNEPVPSFQSGPDLMATDPNAGGNVNLMTPDPVATMPDAPVEEKQPEFTEQSGLDNQLNTVPTTNEFNNQEPVVTEPTNAFNMTPPVPETPQPEPVNTLEEPVVPTPEVAPLPEFQAASEVTPQPEPINAFDMPAPQVEAQPVETINTLEEPVIPTPEVAPLPESQPTPEVVPEPVNAFEMPMPAAETPVQPVEQPAPIENMEMPAINPEPNINEAVNENITETKTCAYCGFANPYPNKTCDKCGQILN